ncbi:MAG: 30S ribosomal protein S12 methylthiotransferase RimO [Candidatus Omnitrophota bacterium]
MKKVYLLSLGCARNLLDSEVLLGIFEKKGFDIVQEPEGADMAVVNTCGFIRDAKEESISIILQLADLKKAGKIKKLVVAGCLSQRYPGELMDEIKEIDGVFGTSDLEKIPEMMDAPPSGARVREVTADPGFLYDHRYKRKLLTSPHSVYLKIQEGCSNRCSYCVIPRLKGPRRSRAIASVAEEVIDLKREHDIKELILIGQDTTSFGLDSSGKPELARLLKEITPLMEGRWVRLLYTHPAHFTDELIDVIAGTENICKYVDLPIQHINDRILKAMNRRVARAEIEALIGKIRKKIKDVTIRSSVIVGFPGETDAEFRELMEFLTDIRFDRLGAFIYSPEEGTPAAGLPGQIPVRTKNARFDEVMRRQQEISYDNNMKCLGRIMRVLIDERDDDDTSRFKGRSQMDAPEVDGVTYVGGDRVKAGDFTEVRITGTMEYDLVGEVA